MQLELDIKACVLPFPAERNRKLVEATARMILQSHDAVAARNWRVVVDDLASPLVAAGVQRSAIEAHVRRFHAAVQQVIWASGADAGGAG